jgi:hypothetical protein
MWIWWLAFANIRQSVVWGLGLQIKKRFIIKICSWLWTETLDTADLLYSYYSPSTPRFFRRFLSSTFSDHRFMYVPHPSHMATSTSSLVLLNFIALWYDEQQCSLKAARLLSRWNASAHTSAFSTQLQFGRLGLKISKIYVKELHRRRTIQYFQHDRLSTMCYNYKRWFQEAAKVNGMFCVVPTLLRNM